MLTKWNRFDWEINEQDYELIETKMQEKIVCMVCICLFTGEKCKLNGVTEIIPNDTYQRQFNEVIFWVRSLLSRPDSLPPILSGLREEEKREKKTKK